MAHQTHPKSRAKRRKHLYGRIGPNFIILGSILLIFGAIAAMIILSQEDEPKLVVVPESQWMPGGDDFTPDFTLAGLEEGSQVSLADFRGKYVMLNFWATWCSPCRAEMPVLQAYYTAHKDENFILLAVNVAEDAATVQTFLDENGFDFPVALDLFSVVHSRYGEPSNGSLPISFLIDPDGRLIKAWKPGMINPDSLASDVSPLLKG